MRSLHLIPLMLACAWTASAQEKKTDPPKTEPQKTPETQPMVGKDTHFLHKASDVLGTDVRDGMTRDELGEVKDFIVNRDGWIDYAVVSLDKGLDTGDKLFVVPWTVLKPAAGKDPDKCDILVTVDKERLRNAPSFDEDRWPDIATVEWSRNVDDFYRNDTRAREAATGPDAPVARPAGMSKGGSFRASKIKGCGVTTTSGEKAGEIEELGLDHQNGRVALLVLASGGFLGLGEDHYALPWQAFSFSRQAAEDDANDDGDLVCRLNIPESKLENAPKYDRSDWKRISDPAYLEKNYTHFGYPIYWKRDAQKPTEDERTNEPKRDEGGGR